MFFIIFKYFSSCRIAILSLSDTRQLVFITNLGPLKKLLQKLSHKYACQNSPKLISLHSQWAKAAQKWTLTKHIKAKTKSYMISTAHRFLPYVRPVFFFLNTFFSFIGLNRREGCNFSRNFYFFWTTTKRSLSRFS